MTGVQTCALPIYIPIIFLAEQKGCQEENCPNNHHQMVAPLGLYNATQMLVEYVIKSIQGQGTVLVIGGMCQTEMGEDGRSKLAAIQASVAPYSDMRVYYIPTSWRYDHAYPKILSELTQQKITPDIILGLSDTLALAGRQAVEELGLLKVKTFTVGFNGDPQALAAIAMGKMTATVETPAFDFGIQAVELAVQAALGKELPKHYNFKPHLITPENVSEASARKLIAIAELPNQLVGVNRLKEHQRVTRLEKSLSINEKIGTMLEHSELSQNIVRLICDSFNYDRVELYLLSEADNQLVLDATTLPGQLGVQLDLNEDDEEVLAQVLTKGELIFVPDTANSQRFCPESRWTNLRTRVALPIRFGGKPFGVLDLQKDSVMQHSREQLLGLQILTDQIAIAIRNAASFSEAVAARKIAEKADKLKTLLLANVSHEFRTPLNIILGYTRGAISQPNSYGAKLPAELKSDLDHIYNSADHLMHLINDLLDLSQAEIDELEIYPSLIDPRPILEEVFLSLADLNATQLQGKLEWHFEAPPRLPLIQADPKRLRQILFNLLSNASKYTPEGQVILGMDVQAPYLHIWVEDSGIGISKDQQELIFEPFMVGHNSRHNSGSIGLGLSITRHLVTLHQGIIKVESQPAEGTTFHVYFPLPSLNGKHQALALDSKQILVYISNRTELPIEIAQLSNQNNIILHKIRPAEVRNQLLELRPTILAWDATTASETDWLAMNYLRTTRQLAELPLMLYSNSSNEETQTNLNNILLKPFSGQTLTTMLEALGSSQLRGDVLLVDDDINSLNFYEQLVHSSISGAVVHRAINGQQAITLLKELSPSLVIIDLVMPEVDGYEVIEWIRQNPSTRNVPVLVISGNLLSSENVQRLDFPRVLFHSKDILEKEEAADIVQKVTEGENYLSQFNSILVKRAIAYLHENFSRPLSMIEITQELGISKNQLAKIFHQELGIALWDYLTRFRIKEARHLLETTDLTVASIATSVGFDDQSYFGKVFRTITSQTPKEYRSDTNRKNKMTNFQR